MYLIYPGTLLEHRSNLDYNFSLFFAFLNKLIKENCYLLLKEDIRVEGTALKWFALFRLPLCKLNSANHRSRKVFCPTLILNITQILAFLMGKSGMIFPFSPIKTELLKWFTLFRFPLCKLTSP